MTAPTGIVSGVGYRNAFIFALNAAGLPAATATTPYEGIRITGNKVLTLTDPEPRRIFHQGDDTIISIDVLPPTEALTGELHTGKENAVLDAAIGNVKVFTVGEMTMLGEATDQRGYEPQVGMLAYRQAQDTDPASATFGQRSWSWRIMPKVQLIARDTGFSDQPEDKTYSVIPAKVSSHLWGTAFTVATEGFTQAQMIRGASWNRPKLVAWLADGTEDEYLFPTTAQAVSTASMTVWKNGTVVSAGITKAVSKVTFTAAPSLNDLIVCLYEVA